MAGFANARGLAFALIGLAALALFAPSALAADNTDRVNRLAVNVERAEALRAVKRLQNAYAQYSEFGLWRDMADLFSTNAELVYGTDTVRGRPAIHKYFVAKFGAGREGLPTRGVHVQMSLTPVIMLSADGASATGRWHELSMLGDANQAGWAGGVQDNDYVKENGVWKIARLHYYAQFAGPYDKGWRSLEADAAFIPFRFTAAEAGRPIPPASPAAKAQTTDLTALETRLAALTAESDITNLQNAYGYYADRKMWDDVVDLFATDGSLVIAGLGAYDGPSSIRRALDRDGPAGLQHGQLNDLLQLNTIVTVAPGAQEAVARGLQLGMTGENNKNAFWSETVFVNRYVKQGGKWRIKEMRLYPKMKTDYYQGWAKSVVVDSAPPEALAPDRPAPVKGPVIPAFTFAHPVTGAAARYPKGAAPLWPSAGFAAPSTAAPNPDPRARVTASERAVNAAIARDAIENISSALGYYIDDGFGDETVWDSLTTLFTEDGGRAMPGLGIFRGHDRIREIATRAHAAGKPSPRTLLPLHNRVQPFISLAPDGGSARLRVRLFQTSSSPSRASTWVGGVYEDQAVLVDGVWKFSLVEIDHVWRSPSLAAGWGKVPENFGARQAEGVVKDFPPDEPPKGVTFAPFPSIGPMWFHYVNPVSGRVPKDYWPD